MFCCDLEHIIYIYIYIDAPVLMLEWDGVKVVVLEASCLHQL